MTRSLFRGSLTAQNGINFQESHCFSEGLGSDFRRLEAEAGLFLRDFFAVKLLAMVAIRDEGATSIYSVIRKYIHRNQDRNSVRLSMALSPMILHSGWI